MLSLSNYSFQFSELNYFATCTRINIVSFYLVNYKRLNGCFRRRIFDLPICSCSCIENGGDNIIYKTKYTNDKIEKTENHMTFLVSCCSIPVSSTTLT